MIYDRLRNTSKRLIEKYGQIEDVLWVKNLNPPPADVDKGWILGETETQEIPVTLIFLPDDRDMRETRHYSHRSVKPKGNALCFMPPVSFIPELKDKVKRNGFVYSVEAIVKWKPNDEQAILHRIRLA